jgi:hypothetical protein
MITVQDIVESPAWFPLQLLPGGALRLIRLDEAAYRAASFLDQRLLAQAPPETSCAIELTQRALAQLVPRAHYIFHTGHVGSTLVARLIGEPASLFCLREPAILRTFASAEALERVSGPGSTLDLRQAAALLSRTWSPGQRAVIKATSFVSELANTLLGVDDQAAALFLFSDPLTYLRTILAGPNSRIESRMLAPSRLKRLRRRLGEGEWPEPSSEGEQVAMSWLCEMTALREAAQPHATRVLWMSFDSFLLAPSAGLASIMRALKVSATSDEIERLVSGPLMRQYSKAPEHPYDAELRREVLQSADWEHAGEIRRGMGWLGQLAQGHGLARAVLAFCSGSKA